MWKGDMTSYTIIIIIRAVLVETVNDDLVES